jgi:potassium-transporting ATPase KdpC subunit
MNLKNQIYPAIAFTIVLTFLLGLIYPFVITGIAQLIFPEKSHGSLVIHENRVIGSRLIGQPFTGDEYFHPRPSAAGDGYDGTSSGGTNFGPTSKKWIDEKIKPEVKRARLCGGSSIPVDLVTSSASGLDPDISPAAAEFQIERVAKARGMSPSAVRNLVHEYSKDRQFGIFGEPRVNVLELNLALDEQKPISKSNEPSR